MKLSTSTSLFGVIVSAFWFWALGNLALSVSASDGIEISGVDDPSAAMIFDPDMNRLSLQGLDPSEPLTEAEADFLASVIRSVFNDFHEAAGIDLYAESVSVGTHALFYNENLANATTTTNNNNNRNLRGERKLEREMQGKHLPENVNLCEYQAGPLRGERIPGCEFDISLYMTCRCWLCFDDDATQGWKWRPTYQPAVKQFTIPTPEPTLSFRDRMKMISNDDDSFDDPTKQPTKQPTIQPTKKPTVKPTVKPTTGKNSQNFDKEILKKLKKSRFNRFKNVKKVRFGFGN